MIINKYLKSEVYKEIKTTKSNKTNDYIQNKKYQSNFKDILDKEEKCNNKKTLNT